MKGYSIDAYILAGCPEMRLPIMRAVHAETGGCVCDTGCVSYAGGKCSHYKRLTTQSVEIVVPIKSEGLPLKSSGPVETVREEAARRGISISEVRKQRNS